MNYDQTNIAAVYDGARGLDPEVLDLWMAALHRHLQKQSVETILDLGCGTGRFSDALASSFAAEVVGVDPSVKMLERARAKPHSGNVRYELGSAESIPLESSSVDIVFMSMCYHHFVDPARAAEECRRVLRKRGLAFVRTGTRERIAAYPYVRFFPSTPAILEETLPTAAELRAVFENAGLQMVALDVITQTIAPSWNAYADKLALGGDSVLARLDPQEFEEGIASIRRHGAESGVSEPIDLFVFG